MTGLESWPPCIKHDGKHQSVYGQCVHWGAPCAIRMGECQDCGEEIAFRRDLRSGRVTIIEAGWDALHRHPAPVRVEIDAEELALGIAGALDSLMQRRREERGAYRPPVAPEATSNDHEPSPPARRILDMDDEP